MLTFIKVVEIYKNTKITNRLFEDLINPRSEIHLNCAIQFLKTKAFKTEEEVLLYLAGTV